MSQPIRDQGGHLVFPIAPPPKKKLGRGLWDLASCQVSLNSVQRFQRRSRKCLSQSEARAAILFFRSARKNTNLVEGVEILLSVKFRWIPFSGFRGEVDNMKVYAGRTTDDGRTDGRRTVRLRLRWAKNDNHTNTVVVPVRGGIPWSAALIVIW